MNFLQIDKTLLGEMEVICFDVFLKKLQVLSKKNPVAGNLDAKFSQVTTRLSELRELYVIP